ncbi:retinaldehyde-binding protein 1 [Parasteatoda tepidariorum]|uniref:retinaldehyde-binding protein 1 n=1 Tax=Parasteatoda tepidariorum TaxID=114398 RepID=UPI00077FC32F
MENAKIIVSGNKVHRPLLDDTVTEEDKRKAEEELNETDESRTVALALFKEFISDQTDFNARTDENYLLRFLRVRKFDVQKSFKALDEHYKFRAKYSDCFPSPSGVAKALKANIFNYLPHRDHKGRAIFVIKFKNWNTDQVSYADFVAVGNLLSEYVLDNPVTQINGFIGIWDFKGFSLKQFMTFCAPKNIYLLTSFMQDRFPGRFKIAYCINCSSFVQPTWNLFKHVLKEKFKKRILIMSSDMAELHKHVDPSILPKEYGGVMPASDATEMAERVLTNEPYFNYNRKFGYDPNDYEKFQHL